MKLIADPEPKVDETAKTATRHRFNRKRRLITQLERIRQDRGRETASLVVDALVSYIDDPYIRHLVSRIELTVE